MSKDMRIIETERPSFKILKWLGAGGFGNVFKVLRNNKTLACKQIQPNNLDFALKEIQHMTLVREGPRIATVHDGLEWNTKTRTLNFFMDYYKGKDLDRQVQMVRAAGERFSETQIIDISYQIAVALEYCHSKNVLHQDIKPMNVLLEDPWDPVIQETVPNLYLADFGIASHVQTLGTRLTTRRGTQGYEAPELLVQSPAAFSQKSDIYALGCILFCLLTLSAPSPLITDMKPDQISPHYSQDLLCIVSAMLSTDRTFRPTATEVREYLTAHIHTNISSTAKECRICRRIIFTSNQFKKHIKNCRHPQNSSPPESEEEHESAASKRERWFERLPSFWADSDDEPLAFTSMGDGNNANSNIKTQAIRNRLPNTSTQSSQLPLALYHSQPTHFINQRREAGEDPEPCAACLKRFASKKKLYTHLYCGHHVRNPEYVYKRLYASDLLIEGGEEPTLMLEDIPNRESDSPRTKVPQSQSQSQSLSRKRGADDDEPLNGFKRSKTQIQTDLPPPDTTFVCTSCTTNF